MQQQKTTGVLDISQFAKKDDLATLKSDVDKLTVVSVDLSKLSNVVNNGWI